MVLVAPLIRVIKGSLSGACIRLEEKQSCVALSCDGVQVNQFLSLTNFRKMTYLLCAIAASNYEKNFFSAITRCKTVSYSSFARF